jgi:hypothetical protein
MEISPTIFVGKDQITVGRTKEFESCYPLASRSQEALIQIPDAVDGKFTGFP